MKYRVLEVAGALLVLVLRLFALRNTEPGPQPPWYGDWIVVTALFWMGAAFADRKPRPQAALLAVACLWLLSIYAVHQGPHTFWIFYPGRR